LLLVVVSCVLLSHITQVLQLRHSVAIEGRQSSSAAGCDAVPAAGCTEHCPGTSPVNGALYIQSTLDSQFNSCQLGDACPRWQSDDRSLCWSSVHCLVIRLFVKLLVRCHVLLCCLITSCDFFQLLTYLVLLWLY